MLQEKRYTIGKLLLRIMKGDITKVNVTAIVNPANSLLIMGGGVAGAIKRAGGEIIEKEAMKHAPIPVGKAVVTSAGRLNAKYIIHAPTMEKPAMRIGKNNVEKAVKAALEKADELEIDSIAFPGMGTGVGGVKADEAADLMIETIVNKWCNKKKEVILVAIEEKLYNAFVESMERIIRQALIPVECKGERRQ